MNYKLILILCLFFVNCKEENKKTIVVSKKEKNEIKTISKKIDYKNISSNFVSWWTYYNNEIDLSSDFLAYDYNSNKISKKEFLNLLTKGESIPVKLENKSYLIYKLLKCDNIEILKTIQQESLKELEYFNREGELLPEFNFITLENKPISSKSLKGNKIIIKTWFINCTACVKEFPELNNLVENSKSKNYTFISFAFDETEKLQFFLKEKPLKYNNISVSKKFIEEKLKLNQYPTHIVIDENGRIEKIFNNSTKLISYLKK
ncbi:TlpA family protein disulfide reductase [Flavobacterium sp.]|uniref:TlpA family protein disulfide reductase n=1 Tax=Flavobacterium sp. TaxID=239 RepID=UPI0035B21CA0